jgi:hypothetical protein
MPRRKNGKLPFDDLMPLSQVARRLGLGTRTVQKDWTSIKQKMGWTDIPEQMLRKMAPIIRQAAEPRKLVGCGSVECRQDWIDLYGDYFDLTA